MAAEEKQEACGDSFHRRNFSPATTSEKLCAFKTIYFQRTKTAP
jgi:hypothetical protein